MVFGEKFRLNFSSNGHSMNGDFGENVPNGLDWSPRNLRKISWRPLLRVLVGFELGWNTKSWFTKILCLTSVNFWSEERTTKSVRPLDHVWPDHRRVPSCRWPSDAGCPGSRTSDASAPHNSEPRKTNYLRQLRWRSRFNLVVAIGQVWSEGMAILVSNPVGPLALDNAWV